MPAPLAAAVRRPVMLQHWRRLTFLHWPYPPPAVQALLPPGLEVETFDGAAWVGLVPFLMDGVGRPACRRCHGRPASRRPTCAPTRSALTGAAPSGSCRWTRPGSAPC